MKTGGLKLPAPVGVKNIFEQGMTLRDYFAAKAMTICPPLFSIVDKAEFAYKMADAMLKAREE